MLNRLLCAVTENSILIGRGKKAGKLLDWKKNSQTLLSNQFWTDKEEKFNHYGSSILITILIVDDE